VNRDKRRKRRERRQQNRENYLENRRLCHEHFLDRQGYPLAIMDQPTPEHVEAVILPWINPSISWYVGSTTSQGHWNNINFAAVSRLYNYIQADEAELPAVLPVAKMHRFIDIFGNDLIGDCAVAGMEHQPSATI
jgi:hypothetical protein